MSHPKPEGQSWIEWDSEHGDTGGSGGTWSIIEGNDGQVYERNSTTGELRLAPPELQAPSQDSLEADLAAIGLRPLTDSGTRKTTGEYGGIGEGISRQFNPGLPEGRTATASQTPYYTDSSGQYYERDGSPVTVAKQKALSGQYGGADSDPYAGAANARAERTMRFNEAMDAIAERRQKIEAYQQAQLKGAGFALPPGQQYFPSMSPTSPLVQSGLIDPMSAQQRINFNPGMVFDAGQQWQQDLARIRAGAGG